MPGQTGVYQVKSREPHASDWSNTGTLAFPVTPLVEEPPVTEAPKEEPPKTEPPKEEPPKTEPPKEEPRLGEDAGRVPYLIDAASYFDTFASNTSWIKAHVNLIKGYPPYSDQYVATGVRVIGYHDPATEGFSPLTATSIASYVSRVKRDMGVGYKGVFIDDANWNLGYRDGGQSKSAVEPEQHELANLTEAIRTAEPGAIIEMNSQPGDLWPLMKAGDPEVARALTKVNDVTLEFGFGATGHLASSATAYREAFEYIDALRAKGVHVCATGDYLHKELSTFEFNQASILLANDGKDTVNGVNQTPLSMWPGFDANLGAATSPRERSSSGVWHRTFTGGAVYTVEPGAATQTITLPAAMHTVTGQTVTQITLAASRGVVLT